MIETALTADAEVRRLRMLAEAAHDWCEPWPRPTPPAEPSAIAGLRRAVGSAMVRCGGRLRSAAPVGVSQATR